MASNVNFRIHSDHTVNDLSAQILRTDVLSVSHGLIAVTPVAAGAATAGRVTTAVTAGPNLAIAVVNTSAVVPGSMVLLTPERGAGNPVGTIYYVATAGVLTIYSNAIEPALFTVNWVVVG